MKKKGLREKVKSGERTVEEARAELSRLAAKSGYCSEAMVAWLRRR